MISVYNGYSTAAINSGSDNYITTLYNCCWCMLLLLLLLWMLLLLLLLLLLMYLLALQPFQSFLRGTYNKQIVQWLKGKGTRLKQQEDAPACLRLRRVGLMHAAEKAVYGGGKNYCWIMHQGLGATLKHHTSLFWRRVGGSIALSVTLQRRWHKNSLAEREAPAWSVLKSERGLAWKWVWVDI